MADSRGESHHTPDDSFNSYRYVVAARDLSAGEVVFSERPLAAGPKQFSGAVCLGCYAPVSSFAREDPEEGPAYRTCPGCGWPACSPECQASPAHRLECGYLKVGGSSSLPIFSFKRMVFFFARAASSSPAPIRPTPTGNCRSTSAWCPSGASWPRRRRRKIGRLGTIKRKTHVPRQQKGPT